MIVGAAETTAYYHPTEFRVGRALSRAFGVLFGNVVTFVSISALATLPTLFLALNTTINATQNARLQIATSLTLTPLCEAMVLYATFQALRGRPVRAAESIGRGLRRFAPVFLATLLTSIVIVAGFFLVIVPGLIAAIVFSLTLPACVVERLDAVKSMKRSSALTRGYRWPIFGALFAVGLVSGVGEAAIEAATMHPATVLVYALLTFGWSTLGTAYQTVLTAIIYHDLRVVKEGIDLDRIAAVFD